ncbi:Plasmid recombination enzyme [Janthinobacterium sp. TND4EL3]|uniref:plasmid recombination protein n=1 Tax=Janthinobacterium sp. TND4EL3 TaxID=1907311 RepID=UPI000955009E|nr:plasmid recombination protein [Janthinobacterium sp. TND4EL3]SIQ03056.1 Plasmid recombination enzyme [Janthinobacterium sp. TND4EL3]
MTEGAHFLAVKPLSVKTTRASCADAVILNVMRHNARELQAEIGVGADSGIDASRIHLNVTLHGPATADGVASAARDAMREHGIVAPRKNATLGIEIVASLPAGLLIDHLAYFRDTAAWAQQHYRVPLLSAIVHNDESSPHLHLVLLPVRDGKLVGSELLGNRATMKAMQKDFHEQVAKQYGLRMPAAKKRHSAAQRAAGIALLRETLQANSGLTECAIDALLVPHAKNPEPLLVALGLAMPAPVVKGSFVATMTRKVRPESPDRIYKKSPIGHLRAQTGGVFLPENENSYALLGLPISAPNFPPSANPSSASNSAPGQQASSSPAAPQSTTDQQRERSTTGAAVPPPGRQGSDEMASHCTADDALSFEDIPPAGAPGMVGASVAGAGQRQPSTSVQNILHTPLVANTNPGTGQAGQQDAHHQTGQLRHQDAAAYSQACQDQHGNAGQATATASAALVSTTPKRKRAAGKVASTTSTTSTPATAHHQAASIDQSAASPASQVATAKTRKRTSRVAASTSPSPRTSAAGIAPAADQADTQTAKPALQQVGHQLGQKHSVHAIEEQAAPGGRPQTGDSGIEPTVDTPATRSAIGDIVPADGTRAVRQVVDAVARTRQHVPSIEHVTPRNAKASTAMPASTPAAPRTGKRSSTASRPAATPSTPSTSTRSSSSTAAPSTSTPKPKRTATLQQASGTPAQDTLPGKAAPVPATPTKRRATSRQASDTPAYATVRQATSSKPALGKGQYDAGADQPDEIRRLADDEQAAARCARSTSSAAPVGVKQGNSQNHRRGRQPNEIRTLGLATCSSMSNASTAPTTRDALKLEPISPAPGSTSYSAEISAQCSWPKFSGQQHSPEYSGQLQVYQQVSQRAGEDDHHGAPALDWLPMPAPRINDSATASQPAPAGIAEHAPYRSPALTIEKAHPQRGASTVAQLRPLEGEQVRHHVDSYQRLRDDEHAAELWDSDRGEFVTALARSAKRVSARGRAEEPYAADLAAVWFDAKPAAIEAALDSIRAVHGQH